MANFHNTPPSGHLRPQNLIGRLNDAAEPVLTYVGPPNPNLDPLPDHLTIQIDPILQQTSGQQQIDHMQQQLQQQQQLQLQQQFQLQQQHMQQQNQHFQQPQLQLQQMLPQQQFQELPPPNQEQTSFLAAFASIGQQMVSQISNLMGTIAGHLINRNPTPPAVTYPPQYPPLPHQNPGTYPTQPQQTVGPAGCQPFSSLQQPGRLIQQKYGQLPFVEEIICAPTPPYFQTPKLKEYRGDEDPGEHLGRFQDSLLMHTLSDALRCRLFLMTLEGEAREWFSSLPPHSIYSFDQFALQFLNHFSSSCKPLKTSETLQAIRQGPSETLREYINRFRSQLKLVTDKKPDVVLSALKMGLRDSAFRQSLGVQPAVTVDDLLSRAFVYINSDEELAAAWGLNYHDSPAPSFQQQPPNRIPSSEITISRHTYKGKASSSNQTGNDRRADDRRPAEKRVHAIDSMDLGLSAPLSAVVSAIQNQPFFRKPEPMKAPPAKRDKRKFCLYHNDHGHETDECRSLKVFLSKLIKEGHLKEFLQEAQQQQQPLKRLKMEEPTQQLPNQIPLNISEDLYTISGGAGPSAAHRNSLLCLSRQVVAASEFIVTPAISFEDKDLPAVPNPFHDAVIIQVVVNSINVHRVLIDTGSSVNVIFHHLLNSLKIAEKNLRPMDGDLVGFVGERRVPEGQISLPVAIRSSDNPSAYSQQLVDFVVLRGQSSYNLILGRPFINDFRAVPSTRHFSIKYPSPVGILTTRGDPVMSRKTYLNAIKVGQSELLSPPREQKAAPVPSGSIDQLSLPPPFEDRTLQISSNLQGNIKTQLCQFLLSNLDIFAWFPCEMPGVDISVASHKLHVDPTIRPIRQKRRKIADDRQKEIKHEVQKLLEAKFIREVQYPEWLANVVMVQKAQGGWRMCVDFTSLNKHCPKDSYPMPAIDSLVDSVNGYSTLSFLDAFSGYHQIRMHPQDQEKTSFITNEGTFCYNVMPFGLRNAGATYQRLMDNIFREQKGRNLEVYIDDILVKSHQAEQHIADLAETFKNLRRYNMKLNPHKCIFGASEGKFLGFMVGPAGIQPNPDKLAAIMSMQPPVNLNQARKFIGKVAALNRFISKSGEKCAGLFKSLKKADSYYWTEECQQNFNQLKEYLTSPPVMSSPKADEDLFLYLSASNSSVASVLLREENLRQKPVYFISKTLVGAEKNYSMLEKLVYALITAVRRLRVYFQAHKVIVVTDRPLRHIIQRPDVSGRLAKWAVELSGYDIQFVPRISIKAQVLADFMTDLPSAADEDSGDEEEIEQSWEAHTDGASADQFCGIGFILRSPEGVTLQGSVSLLFRATNNQAEYEAVLAALKLANAIGIKNLILHSDSLLVVKQVTKEYECKDPYLLKYLDLVRTEIALLHQFKICHVLREGNQEADQLSKGACPAAVMIKELSRPSIEEADSSEIASVGTEEQDTWMKPIMEYLSRGTLPPSKAAAGALKAKSARYFLYQDLLYRKSFSDISLKCVHPEQTETILAEVHSGDCGSHSSGQVLAQKILRQGYYWPTLKADAIQHAKKCQACQLYGNILHQPAQPLLPIISPWPFAMWGMDFVGPFPMGTGQRKFMLVLIDYFTKWIEAVALPKATTEAVIKFLSKDVFSRFGLPMYIVTDNGTQFNNSKLKAFCEQNGVTLKFASVAHPQSNGQAEAANKTILSILKKRLMGKKGLWADELPAVLWSYRTTPSTVTKESPFALAFGMEAVTPAELIIPTGRVKRAMAMELDQPSEWAQLNQNLISSSLDFAEEKRSAALIRITLQKQMAKRALGNKVKVRLFQPGDLVLRKLEVTGRQEGIGKLSPNWEGPYLIKRIAGPSAYQLQNSEGTDLPRTWSGNDLKLYRP